MLMGTVKSCTRAGGATVNVSWNSHEDGQCLSPFGLQTTNCYFEQPYDHVGYSSICLKILTLYQQGNIANFRCPSSAALP